MRIELQLQLPRLTSNSKCERIFGKTQKDQMCDAAQLPSIPSRIEIKQFPRFVSRPKTQFPFQPLSGSSSTYQSLDFKTRRSNKGLCYKTQKPNSTGTSIFRCFSCFSISGDPCTEKKSYWHATTQLICFCSQLNVDF